ncbi:uncharacterized protein BO96DRAFT_414977 [Aspergillus niger CBS 101883]|uniref:uncharacterized protein n=1 Tax=Aspergillus lacticoffeatus (strain CBS 101883) TaxID=1450533 RepID=UPI000D7F0A73|nr:uncharacterized protein BO96DRAFT_414977 [Aspergillus niger CBS 101883]PYH53035.1 hypothetical protein BO96DRAFT_414977 [Aspergillus niger CBS 101883]
MEVLLAFLFTIARKAHHHLDPRKRRPATSTYLKVIFHESHCLSMNSWLDTDKCGILVALHSISSMPLVTQGLMRRVLSMKHESCNSSTVNS